MLLFSRFSRVKPMTKYHCFSTITSNSYKSALATSLKNQIHIYERNKSISIGLTTLCTGVFVYNFAKTLDPIIYFSSGLAACFFKDSIEENNNRLEIVNSLNCFDPDYSKIEKFINVDDNWRSEQMRQVLELEKKLGITKFNQKYLNGLPPNFSFDQLYDKVVKN